MGEAHVGRQHQKLGQRALRRLVPVEANAGRQRVTLRAKAEAGSRHQRADLRQVVRAGLGHWHARHSS